MTVQAHRAMHTALRHREQYLRKLRETIPDLPMPGATPPRHQSVSGAGGGEGDGQGGDLMRLAARTLKLPPGWLTNASRALEQACADIIPGTEVRRTGNFTCALIHPSYVIPLNLTSSSFSSSSSSSLRAVRALRSRVAMTSSVSLSGSASLRILVELSRKHSEAVALARHAASAHECDLHDEPRHSRDSINSDGVPSERNESSSHTRKDRDHADVNQRCTDGLARDDGSDSDTASVPPPRTPRSRQNATLVASMVDMTVPSLHQRALSSVPSALGLNAFILFDKSAFPSWQKAYETHGALRQANALPEEVAMGATVALCGAVYTAGGMHAVAAFLDRALRVT